MSAFSIEASVLITLYLSISSLILLLRLRPAVSISRKLSSPILILLSIESRVVPGISLTIFLFSPSKSFINEDFPTLGFPTKAIFISSSSTDAE